MNHHLAQARQDVFEAVPNPPRDIFAGWILESFDVVQAVMIQLLAQWLKRFLELSKIAHPACLRVHPAMHVNFTAKAVAVQASTLVAFRRGGQPMRRFKANFPDDGRAHQIASHRVRPRNTIAEAASVLGSSFPRPFGEYPLRFISLLTQWSKRAILSACAQTLTDAGKRAHRHEQHNHPRAWQGPLAAPVRELELRPRIRHTCGAEPTRTDNPYSAARQPDALVDRGSVSPA